MADDRASAQERLAATRRGQILDAAQQVFSEQGFHRATVRDVARAAGLADGTIYIYFANKTDLLIGLLDRLNDTERRPASLALAATAPIEDHVRAYLRERVEALWANADLFRAVLPELLANPDLRKRYYDEVIAPTTTLGEGLFGGLIASGILRDLDAPLSIRIVAGAVLGLMVLQLLGDETLAARLQDLPDALADLLLPGLLAEYPKAEDTH